MRQSKPPFWMAFAGLMLAGSICAEGSGLSEHELFHDGQMRQYLLYAPTGTEGLSARLPLVVVLHGGGGTHRGILRLTRGRFNELADRDGFFVLYPNAVKKFWDFGEGQVSNDLDTRVDDEGFFARLIDDLIATYPIDPSRVFATGISRGGQAAYFLACKLPGTLRAVAPVTMPLPDFLEDDCRDGPPTGIAIVNGTMDPIVPYDGGAVRLLGRYRGEVLSTKETVELWLRRNSCTSDRVEEAVLDDADDGLQVKKSAWLGCSGAPVVLYSVVGGGHTWPSGTQYFPRALIGSVSQDMDAADEIWGFFTSFAAGSSSGRVGEDLPVESADGPD